MRRAVKWVAALALSVLLAGVVSAQTGAAETGPAQTGTAESGATQSTVGTTSIQIEMTAGQNEAVVNGGPVPLEASAMVEDGIPYVPAAVLCKLLDLPLTWDGETQSVNIVPNGKVKIRFDFPNHAVAVNGVSVPFDRVALIRDNRLMVQLGWFAGLVGADWEYRQESQSIKLVYVPTPDGTYQESGGDSVPVAKFAFAKPAYRIGEPVKYEDLSYDPDAEGLVNYTWTGRQDVYFKAGEYPITLQVSDAKGHISKTYTRILHILPETYLTDLQYRLNFTEVGSTFKTNWGELWANFNELPEVPKTVTEDRTRKLIVSDSPETIKEKGILYQENVNGKARLYADHVNGSEGNVQFTIMARNLTNKPVTIRTTNKGEVYPSIYANLIGHEASVDFMLHDPIDEKLVVPVGQDYVYVKMPDFYPGQGVNCFYDVETDGEVEFTFLAMDKMQTPTYAAVKMYKSLDFDGHVRGTFPVSGKEMNLDLSKLDHPSRIVIGDGEKDPLVKGTDTFRKGDVYDDGNYGMIYNIHVDKPPRMAVLLLARGGYFKGPFKVNGEFVMVPKSGVLPAFEQLEVLARTTGDEDALDIEFTPPAGSAFPIDIIFYPLDELKK